MLSRASAVWWQTVTVVGMSTYVEVFGSVELDMEAAALLMALPTWEWVGEPSGEFDVTRHPDGSLSIVFHGGSIRNIGRYLETDLAFAMSLGEVRGELVIDCTDGCHQRTVVVFDAGDVLVGRDECFAKPVTLHKASLVPFDEVFGLVPLSDSSKFFADLGHLWVLVPDLASDVSRVHETRRPGLCACAGFEDDDLDEPRCASQPLP